MHSRVSPFLAFVCASGLATALAACGGSGSNGVANPASGSVPGVMPDSVTAQAQRDTVSSATTMNATPHEWNVQVGASTLDQGFQDLDFYANTITIDAGDKVTWRIAAEEPHTVSFLAPGQTAPPPTSPQALKPAGSNTFDGTTFTSSGTLTDGQTYTLTFLKPGIYKYHCLIHQPEMSETIVVQKAGTPYPHSQAFFTHAGEEDEWVDLNAATASIRQFPYKVGGTTLAAGMAPGLATGKPAQSTVLRFVDVNDASAVDKTREITVPVGTTVTWVDQSNNEPHTVTFPAGHPLPSNPFAPPSGGHTFDGTTLTNSGVFFPGQKYSLTFVKQGFYEYFCLFHHNEGMYGWVNVK